jgi:hypothetical protein
MIEDVDKSLIRSAFNFGEHAQHHSNQPMAHPSRSRQEDEFQSTAIWERASDRGRRMFPGSNLAKLAGTLPGGFSRPPYSNVLQRLATRR